MTELRERLDSLARLAGDDASAERMLGRVAPMVHAVRRRRTARHVGMSAAGLGTAAAVGLVGVAVGGGSTGPRGVGPAGGPSGVWPAEATACGAEITPGVPDEGGLRLFAGFSGSVDDPVLSQTASNRGGATTWVTDDPAGEVLVLRAGRVVARAAAQISGVLETGSAIASVGHASELSLCTGVRLDDGDYQVVVVATTGFPHDRVTTVGEPTTAVVSKGVATTPDYDRLNEAIGVQRGSAPEPTASPDPVPFREGSDACAQPMPGTSGAPDVTSSVTLEASASVIGDVAALERPEVVVKARNSGPTQLNLGLMLSARVVVFQGTTPVVAYTSEDAPLGPSGDAGGELALEPDQEVGYVAGLLDPEWCLSGVDRLDDGDYFVATMATVSVDGVSRSVVSLDAATATDGVLATGTTTSAYVARKSPGSQG